MENNNEHNGVGTVLEQTLTRLREMIDVNAVVGQPITTPDGTTLIPVTKVAFGFASGGTDGNNLRFGAGSGAGVTMTPLAFLVVQNGNVRMIYLDRGTNTALDKAIDLVPTVIEKFTKKNGKAEETPVY